LAQVAIDSLLLTSCAGVGLALAAMASAEAWGVGGVFALMVVSNILSNKKVFGGKDNKEISDENPTYVSPDGPTFAIWGFIYSLELVLVFAQLSPSHHMERVFARTCPLTGLNVRERLMAAFLANGVWLPIFNRERFGAALLIMLVYLALLLSTYMDLNVENTSSFVEALTLTAGIAMNTSWIVVASLVNVFLCGGTCGWKDEYGVAGSVSAAVVAVMAVTALGCERAWRGSDLARAFVASWALRGIYRMQMVPDTVRFPLSAMNTKLAAVASGGSFAVAAVIAVTAGLMLHRQFGSG